MELLQIVPMLPPALSGVGDYALLLAQELQTNHGVRTRFLCGDPGWRGQEESVAPFPAEAVREHTKSAMLRAVNEAAADDQVILLHYVGYGYAHRGCPEWLVRALEHWKRDHPTGRLIVLFHELYASGPPWSSAFWTHPFQKSLVKRLGHVGDLFLTPTAVVGRLLRPLLDERRGQEVKVWPVFSTIGEPAGFPPLAERRRQMVVFGSPHWRMQAYTRQAGHLLAACQKLGIERIVDVGPDAEGLPPLPFPVEARGALPAAEARALFAESLAGFFAYPVFVLGKSTIFAAYCAHGMLPVTFAGNGSHSEDGLHEGEHYLTDGDDSLTVSRKVEEVAAAAFSWYARHNCESLAREIAQQVGSLVAL